jgi:hypothetical protein
MLFNEIIAVHHEKEKTHKYVLRIKSIFMLKQMVHIVTTVLQRHGELSCARLEVFTAVTIKNGVVRDGTTCGSCKNRRFGALTASFIRVTRILRNVLRLLVAAHVPSSPILITPMMQAIRSSETSVHTA